MRMILSSVIVLLALPAGALSPPPTPDQSFDQLRERLEALNENLEAQRFRLIRLGSKIAGIGQPTRVLIAHADTVRSGMILDSIKWWVDGKRVEVRDGVVVLSGEVAGGHSLRFEAVYRGDGGFFSYMDGYRVRIRSQHDFYVRAGRTTIVHVDVFNTDITFDAINRFGVRFRVTSTQP